jgi:uncharacterized protein YecA (UPF0149 family)
VSALCYCHKPQITKTERGQAFCEKCRNWFDESENGLNRVPAVSAKVGRNDPCPCGSGKKHKRCCLA